MTRFSRLLVLFFIVAPVMAHGDGLIVRPIVDASTSIENAYAEEETHQRAFLYYDPTGSIERLVIEVRTGMFSGNFAWFIPLPPADRVPTVQFEEVPPENNVFTLLDRLTGPQVVMRTYFMDHFRPQGCTLGCSVEMYLGQDAADKAEETVLSEVVVWGSGETASFSYSHVSTPTLSQLVSWCVDNGYGLPGGAAQSIILDYVEREWSFVLVQGVKSTESPHGGCISLTFSPVASPVFPLAISGPGHLSRMPVDLLVVSPESMEPVHGVAEFVAQVVLAPGWDSDEIQHVEMHLIDPGTNPYFDEYLLSFSLFSDEDEIPSGAELFQGVLASPYLDSLREGMYGDTSWWRFSSHILTSEEPDELSRAVHEYLGGLVTGDELIVSRFYRAFDEGESLEDVFFQPGTGEVPFIGRLYTEAAVLDPDRLESGAGVDGSFIIGLAIWVACKSGTFRRHHSRLCRKEKKNPQRCS